MKKPSLLPRLQQKLSEIPYGKVVTYAELARALDMTGAARAVGSTCGQNPEPDKYPCFKVVKSDGGVGGFSVEEGVSDKIRRLREEGIEVINDRIVDFEAKKHSF